ncbi:MAG: four helix bundle protein [Planctomycetes bacterium]|jgi:four helix bundle protein|nr:four helix bundle protein [Planctomycetota bacterium]
MAKLDVEDLQVWQLAMESIAEIYRVTQAWPKEELYGLTSQVRRAAVSVAANIAEGKARDSTAEFLRFIAIAAGSNSEVQTLVRVARKVGILKENDFESLDEKPVRIAQMLGALRRSLKKRL